MCLNTQEHAVRISRLFWGGGVGAVGHGGVPGYCGVS